MSASIPDRNRQTNALAAQRKYLETQSRWHEAEYRVDGDRVAVIVADQVNQFLPILHAHANGVGIQPWRWRRWRRGGLPGLGDAF